MPGPRDSPVSSSWFHDAFGFDEEQQDGIHGQHKHAGVCGEDRMRLLFEGTRSRFEAVDDVLRERATGRPLGRIGRFELPTLAELRSRAAEAQQVAPDAFLSAGELTFQNVVGATYAMYQDGANAGSVFQVASLFNCLETSPPGAAPEDGVARYANEAAQGPASAAACPAATVFRNYLHGGGGQRRDTGIDCLSDVGALLKNDEEGYWRMRSGYALERSPGSIARLGRRLQGDPGLASAVEDRLRVGIHWDAEVATGGHSVCQVFCSALPVGLCKTARTGDWQAFACAVLRGAYAATLAAASILAAQRGERVRVFLTTVGGGVLGNRQNWVADALDAALSAFKMDPLDVMLVHYDSAPTEGPFAALESGRLPLSVTRAMTPGHKKRRKQDLSMSHALTDMRVEISRQGSIVIGGMDRTLNRFDANGDGLIDAEELSEVERFNREHALKVARVFAVIDANGDGVIDRKEFVDVLQLVDPVFFTPRTIGILLDEADANGDGVVHYSEFFAWLFAEDPTIVGAMLQTTWLADDLGE